MDKALHVLVSALLVTTLPLPKWTAVGVAVGIGAARELVQHQGWEGWRDMAANTIGVTVGFTLRW